MAEYVKINHPVLGDIEIRADLAASLSGAELNKLLIDETAKQLGEQGVELSSFDTFTGQFAREVTSSSRGIQELAGAEPTTNYEDDFLSELALEVNPVSGYSGMIAGAIADPVTIPFVFGKLLKLGRIGSMALGGGIAGGIQPTREEFGDSRLFNVGAGTVGGAALGGIVTVALRKMGYDSPEMLQEAFDNADEAGKARIQKEFEQSLNEANPVAQRTDEVPTLEGVPEIPKPKNVAEAEAAVAKGEDELLRAADEQRFKVESEEYNARIKDEVAKLQEEVDNLPTRGQTKQFEKAVSEHTSYINKFKDRIANIDRSIKAINESKIAPKAKRSQVAKLEAQKAEAQKAADERQALLDQREGPLLERINYLRTARKELDAYYKDGVLPEQVRLNIGAAPKAPEAPVQREVTQPSMVAQQAPQPAQVSTQAPTQLDVPTGGMMPMQDVAAPMSRAVEPTPVATPTPRQDVQPVQQANMPATPEEGAIKRGLDIALGAISTRLEKIAPSIMHALRKFEANVLQKQAEYINPTEKFFKVIHSSPPELQRKLKSHLYNGRLDEAEKLMPPATRAEFKKIKKNLYKMHKELREAGIDVAYVDNYFPRKVKDVKGLRAALNRSHPDKITKALDEAVAKNKGRPLDPLQEEDVINKVVRDVYRPKDAARRGNIGKRSITEVPDELLDFYYDPSQALTLYYRSMVDMAEKAKFFGRNKVVTDNNTIDVTDSIGNVIRDAMIVRNMNEQQIDDMVTLLTARFVEGEKAPAGPLRFLRDTGYMGTIGNFVSAITNLGDLGTSGALHGFRNTIKAALESAVGKELKYDVVDMGIDHSISHELQDNKATAKLLQTVFKYSGFRGTDRLGKNALMNAAMSKNEKLAKTEAGKAALRKKWGAAFGDEMDGLIVDLEKGNVTENTKLLAFHELSNVQPISLSEMPQYYLEHPDGRIVYMMKSFTLKQLDIVRKNILQEAKKGNYWVASKNLAVIGGYLAAANTGTQVVKDWILGRDIDPDKLPEQAVWNVLSVIGFNKYIADRYLSQGDIKGAFVNTIVPPVPLLETLRKGTKETERMLEGEEYNYAKLSKELPVVGSWIYSHFGGGKENYNERLAKED